MSFELKTLGFEKLSRQISFQVRIICYLGSFMSFFFFQIRCWFQFFRFLYSIVDDYGFCFITFMSTGGLIWFLAVLVSNSMLMSGLSETGAWVVLGTCLRSRMGIADWF